MIDAFIDKGRHSTGLISFRGRLLPYWIELAFPNCRFRDVSHGASGRGFVIVFSTDAFPAAAPEAVAELDRRLKGRAFTAGRPAAPPGRAFFLVPGAFLSAHGLSLGPGVFRRLGALSGVEELPLNTPVVALDPRSDPLRVEAAVVALQARHFRRRGVILESLGDFYMEGLPVVGRGTRIGPGAVIRGDSRVGKGVVIYPNCFIENSRIGDRCILLPGSVIRDSIVESDVQLGPYCHLRNGARVRSGAKMGNFVEMKKSVLGRGSKAMHLSYIGDATVGRKVNIGAGTITCNFDGEKKNPTRIGDGVFVGSGTELVAPVTVCRDSYVAAGSTITEDVPRHALAVARQRQRIVPGWVLRKRKR